MEILLEMSVKNPAAEIYRALTERDGLASWFAADTLAEPRVGSLAEFRFDHDARLIQVRVGELDPGRRIVWQVLQGLPAWEQEQGTITWTLTPAGWGGTLVHFSHGGWNTTGGAFPSTGFKWATFMAQLKAYLATGAVNPAT